MSLLRLEGVTHAYLGRSVLEDIHLAVEAEQIVALVGTSGCGKSTLLHIAAGLIEPVRGRVVRRHQRHGVVFQEPRLLPWATARGNIDYALRRQGLDAAARRAAVARVAAGVALAARDLDKYPSELSGGMAQRVAVARALAIQPDFVCLDEPFSALDVGLKRRLQDLTIAALDQAGVSALFVTHDLAEAARVAHRIVILDRAGRGLAGTYDLPGRPGQRSDREVFEMVDTLLQRAPLLAEVGTVEEVD